MVLMESYRSRNDVEIAAPRVLPCAEHHVRQLHHETRPLGNLLRVPQERHRRDRDTAAADAEDPSEKTRQSSDGK